MHPLVHTFNIAHNSLSILQQAMAASDAKVLCKVCSKTVTRRQQALECDKCQRWTHRLCGTGVTQADYLKLVRNGDDFEWICPSCIRNAAEEEDDIGALQFESTRMDGLLYHRYGICNRPTVRAGNRVTRF